MDGMAVFANSRKMHKSAVTGNGFECAVARQCIFRKLHSVCKKTLSLTLPCCGHKPAVQQQFQLRNENLLRRRPFSEHREGKAGVAEQEADSKTLW